MVVVVMDRTVTIKVAIKAVKCRATIKDPVVCKTIRAVALITKAGVSKVKVSSKPGASKLVNRTGEHRLVRHGEHKDTDR